MMIYPNLADVLLAVFIIFVILCAGRLGRWGDKVGKWLGLGKSLSADKALRAADKKS